MNSIRAILFSLVFALSACSQSPVEDNELEEAVKNTKIQVISTPEKGRVLSEITDSQKVSKIITLFETKKPMLEKMLPIFTMEIIIESNGEREVWLFAKPKYLQMKSSKNTQIYKVEKHQELTSLMFN